MQTANSIHRAAIRRLLEETFRSSSDLDAFCLDYFPHVKCRFSTEMDRTTKLNILLECTDMTTILDVLNRKKEVNEIRIFPTLNQIDESDRRLAKKHTTRISQLIACSMMGIFSGWILHSMIISRHDAPVSSKIYFDNTKIKPSGNSLDSAGKSIVEWSIDSIPRRAQVIRERDHMILGTTPWHYTQPESSGYEKFTLKSTKGNEVTIFIAKESSANIRVDFSPMRHELRSVNTAKEVMHHVIPLIH